MTRKTIGQTHTTQPPQTRQVPSMMYGTAWKEDKTYEYTQHAVKAGFRAIDTANQRKHYVEADVGDAVHDLIEQGLVTRDDLFIQTKFTHIDGQDDRLPYDANAPIYAQVAQSIERSLEHLKTSYIDAYILHGPSQAYGLGDDDYTAWRAMEAAYQNASVKSLGVSNVSLEQLEKLLEFATITPSFVQNRCFAQSGWDADVRTLCDEHNIIYQGFSLLTANIRLITHSSIQDIARHMQLTLPQTIFLFACQVGMLPLTGTTDPSHMAQDLAVRDEALLTPEDCHTILTIASTLERTP